MPARRSRKVCLWSLLLETIVVACVTLVSILEKAYFLTAVAVLGLLAAIFLLVAFLKKRLFWLWMHILVVLVYTVVVGYQAALILNIAPTPGLLSKDKTPFTGKTLAADPASVFRVVFIGLYALGFLSSLVAIVSTMVYFIVSAKGKSTPDESGKVDSTDSEMEFIPPEKSAFGTGRPPGSRQMSTSSGSTAFQGSENSLSRPPASHVSSYSYKRHDETGSMGRFQPNYAESVYSSASGRPMTPSMPMNPVTSGYVPPPIQYSVGESSPMRGASRPSSPYEDPRNYNDSQPSMNRRQGGGGYRDDNSDVSTYILADARKARSDFHDGDGGGEGEYHRPSKLGNVISRSSPDLRAGGRPNDANGSTMGGGSAVGSSAGGGGSAGVISSKYSFAPPPIPPSEEVDDGSDGYSDGGTSTILPMDSISQIGVRTFDEPPPQNPAAYGRYPYSQQSPYHQQYPPQPQPPQQAFNGYRPSYSTPHHNPARSFDPAPNPRSHRPPLPNNNNYR